MISALQTTKSDIVHVTPCFHANVTLTGRRSALLLLAAPLAPLQLGAARASTLACQGERGYALQQVSDSRCDLVLFLQAA